MLKSLAPVIFILLAGGFWWYSNANSAKPVQQGLEQAPIAPEVETQPAKIANLEAPSSQVRERSPDVEESAASDANSTNSMETNEPDATTIKAFVPHSTLTVRAFVVDWNEQPVIDTDLELGYETLPYRSSRIEPAFTHYSVRSNSEGRVQVELGLPDGELKQIAIWIEDKSRQAKGWVEPVNVIANGRGNLGTIQIFEAREKFPTPLVQGRALSESGKALSFMNGAFYWGLDFEVEISAFSSKVLPSQSRDSGQVILMPTGHFQAFGPDTWIAADIVIGSPGYMDARQNLQKLPADNVQLTLHPALPLHGTLKVPSAGPPVEEYGIHLSQECGGSLVSPGTDGTFKSRIASQALTLTVTHRNRGTALFMHEYQGAPDEKSGLGIIDLTSQVQVVDLTLSDLQGEFISNEDVFLSAPGMAFIGQYFKTDEGGRLLTVVPRTITAIQLFRRTRSLPISQKAVEILLPASPSKVALP
jgi:hypothetical protein